MKDQRNKNPTKTWRTVEDRVLGHKLLYIRALQHPPYSQDLVPADYSLFWRIKSDLADVSITHETFKTELERVLRSIGENEFTGAFQR